MTPITRREAYLAYIAGTYSGDLPAPVTREEQLLYDIAVNGGAGGKGKPYVIMGAYDTAAELEAAHPTGEAGDAYLVGSPSHVYVWLVNDERWDDAGAFTAIAGEKGDKGDKGDKGNKGDAATVSVGTVTTGAAGTDASVTNSGTGSAAVFDFVIPRGATGATGAQGVKGDKGDTGAKGAQGIQGEKGDTPTVEVGTVQTVDYTDPAEVTETATATGIELNFKIPRGRPGEGGGGSGTVESVNGKLPDADGNVVISKADISLNNVDNTADLDKPISTAQATVNTGFDTRITQLEENPVNPFQFDTMPDAEDHPQEVVEFIGADTALYKRGWFYRSTPVVESGNLSYVWQQIDTQPSNSNYEDMQNKPEINGVALLGNKTSADLALQDEIQFTTMPTAAATNLGRVYQYVGATTADFKKGYFYQCVYDSDNSAYIWQKTDVSDNAALSGAVSTIQTDIGDISRLEVTGVADLVSAINRVNSKAGITRYEYIEPNLIIYYNDGSTFQISVSSILNETQIGELANVIDTTIADGNILQYDAALQQYKPYAILVTLQNLLAESKQYTDDSIASAVVAGAYVCDEKPAYDAENDTVIYKQNGVTKTTTQTDARFYYYSDGDPFCTSWIDDIEFTFSVADVDFEDYVNKNTDVVSTYTEDMLDKTKIPTVAALDALLAIVKTALSEKVNTSDIIDTLTSSDATKPLSAKQGKTLKDLVDTKNDRMQYAEMPVADQPYLGKVAQYVGTTGQAYTKGYFYQCKYDSENEVYYWDIVKYAADVDAVPTENSNNAVSSGGTFTALATKQNSTLSAPLVIGENSYTTVETAITGLKAYAATMQTKTLATPVTMDGTVYTDVETLLGALCLRSVDVDGATIVKDSTTGVLSAVKATANSVGVVKPDGTTLTVDADGTMHGANTLTFDDDDFDVDNNTVALSAAQRIFTGTTAEWDALTAEEKANYTVVNFPDDESPEEFNTRLSAVEDVIPSEASASNSLATISDVDGLLNAPNTTKYTSDLNTCIEAGVHVFNQSTANRPNYVNWGCILVFGVNTKDDNNKYIYQLLFPTTGVTKFRYSINSTTQIPTNWTSWQDIIKTSDLTSSVIQNSGAPITSGGVYSELNTISNHTVTKVSSNISNTDLYTSCVSKNGICDIGISFCVTGTLGDGEIMFSGLPKAGWLTRFAIVGYNDSTSVPSLFGNVGVSSDGNIEARGNIVAGQYYLHTAYIIAN